MLEEIEKTLIEIKNILLEIKEKQNSSNIENSSTKLLIYDKECKNCGKKYKAFKKSDNFCCKECKKEYMKKKRHEYYIKLQSTLTEEEKKKKNNETAERMKEMRKLRKEVATKLINENKNV